MVGWILVESDATWSGGTNNARISFHVKQDTSLTERLTILSSGNVGIGTTGPNETDCCGGKQCFRVVRYWFRRLDVSENDCVHRQYQSGSYFEAPKAW